MSAASAYCRTTSSIGDQALILQPNKILGGQRVEDRERRLRDVLGGRKLGAADKDGERAERAALLVVEKLHAPFEGAPECPLALRRVARAVLKYRQRVLKAGDELLGGEQADPPGCSSKASGRPSSRAAQPAATAAPFASR